MTRLKETTSEEFDVLKRSLEAGRRWMVPIMSGSMEPLIGTGEYIVVEKVEHPKLFDILVFRQNSILICHFVKGTIVMSGDLGETLYITGNLRDRRYEDLPVPASDILGVVISHRLSRFTRFRHLIRALLTR